MGDRRIEPLLALTSPGGAKCETPQASPEEEAEKENTASKRLKVNDGMYILFTFSLFEAVDQRKVCPPRLRLGFLG